MKTNKQIHVISDTVLGYGSSQILLLTESLAKYFGLNHVIYEPFVPGRMTSSKHKALLGIETVVTVEHPWSFVGRQAYIKTVAQRINENKPRVIIIANYNLFQILDFLTFKPKTIIHLALEGLDQFSDSIDDQIIMDSIKKNSKKISHWIFPEKNRAIHDSQILRIEWHKISMLYNVSQQTADYVAPELRLPRFVYAGSIDFDRTIASFFDVPKTHKFPIDVYGGLQNKNPREKAFLELAQKKKSKMLYAGELSNAALLERLPKYSYALIYWHPTSFSTRNAAPNKLFQAIGCGVPVICSPNPQCIEIIEQFDCGVVIPDWSYESLIHVLSRQLKNIGSARHAELIQNCKIAAQSELNWENQFKQFQQKMELQKL